MRNVPAKVDHMNIAVIGSGPCGAVAALKLLRSGHNVTMLDIGQKVNMDSQLNSNSKNFPGNSVKGAPEYYDFDEFNKYHLQNGSRNWYTSKAEGGFSSVWGATWETQNTILGPNWADAYKEADQLVFGEIMELASSQHFGPRIKQGAVCICFEDVLKRLGSNEFQPNLELTYRIPELAVSASRCDFNGNCIVHCANKAIWNSKILLLACKTYKTFVYSPGSFVTSLYDSTFGVEVLTEKYERSFDACVLAAGPIANASLILRSKLKNQIDLGDTRIVAMVFVRLRKPKKHLGEFSLAGLSLNMKAGSYFQFPTHIQLYSHANRFIDRIKNLIPKPFRMLFLKLFQGLSRYVVFGLMYTDEKDSTSLRLTGVGITQVEYVKNSRATKALISQYVFLLKNYKKTGLIPLPIMKLGHPGDSYHVGNAKNNAVDDYGVLTGHPNILVAGSFSLPRLFGGAITRSAMAQTVRMVDRFQTLRS